MLDLRRNSNRTVISRDIRGFVVTIDGVFQREQDFLWGNVMEIENRESILLTQSNQLFASKNQKQTLWSFLSIWFLRDMVFGFFRVFKTSIEGICRDSCGNSLSSNGNNKLRRRDSRTLKTDDFDRNCSLISQIF
jgi:hypothetical protein